MPIPINTKRVPAKLLTPGNIIMYLDQLWKVTEITKSDSTYVCFVATRQTNPAISDPCHYEINQDDLYFTRKPEVEIVVIEDDTLIEELIN